MIKNMAESYSHQELQYLNLVNDIIEKGTFEKGRNGNTLSVFGSAMYFSLENNTIPLLTTKKLAWKTCLKELLWFIRGETDNKKLRDVFVRIWDANASREFLDSRGLVNNEVDDLGPVYGHQWRHFNAPYINCHTNYKGKGVDQLQGIIDCLKDPEKRSSRRMVMSAWNPCQIDEMALPPCHVLCQFNVTNGNKLSCALYQRSGDIGLGVPFNIASYCFLTHILANHCGLLAHEFIYTLGNSHIYEEHVDVLKEQTNRIPFEFPKIKIKNFHKNINDYVFEDISILEYKCHEPIYMKIIP